MDVSGSIQRENIGYERDFVKSVVQELDLAFVSTNGTRRLLSVSNRLGKYISMSGFKIFFFCCDPMDARRQTKIGSVVPHIHLQSNLDACQTSLCSFLS